MDCAPTRCGIDVRAGSAATPLAQAPGHETDQLRLVLHCFPVDDDVDQDGYSSHHDHARHERGRLGHRAVPDSSSKTLPACGCKAARGGFILQDEPACTSAKRFVDVVIVVERG